MMFALPKHARVQIYLGLWGVIEESVGPVTMAQWPDVRFRSLCATMQFVMR